MEYKTRVMLVEDEATAREILGFYLSTLFDEVLVAKDGEEGVALFKAHQPIDLILTDIKMPNMDGMSMIEAIRELQEDQKFIVVSAHKEEELLLRSINLRVIGYFVKPLNIDTVMEILQKAKAEVLREKKIMQIRVLCDSMTRFVLIITHCYFITKMETSCLFLKKSLNYCKL